MVPVWKKKHQKKFMPLDQEPESPPVCDYEGSTYQSDFWDQGGREYEDQVEAIALRRLLPAGGRLLLEIGAGAGRNTPRYHQFERIVLLDYSRTQLEQAQKNLGAAERYVFVVADVYRLPFVRGLFDVATMIRVIHHLVEPERALTQIRKTIATGGTFILEFANKRNLKAILRFAFGRQKWNPFHHDPIEFAKLNYNFHPRAIDEWLTASGFSKKRQLTVSHFRIGILKRLVPLRMLVAADSAVQWTGNLFQLTPSVFVSAQAVGDGNNATSGDFFKCPKCAHHPLDQSSDAMICSACHARWSFRDGIYDFKEPL